jgi:hypothetical protein
MTGIIDHRVPRFLGLLVPRDKARNNTEEPEAPRNPRNSPGRTRHSRLILNPDIESAASNSLNLAGGTATRPLHRPIRNLPEKRVFS